MNRKNTYFSRYRFLILFSSLFLSLYAEAAGYKLWYDKPASVWTEALPLGNGRLGAMVYGDPVNEEIQLNEALVKQERDISDTPINEHVNDLRLMYDPAWLENMTPLSFGDDYNKYSIDGNKSEESAFIISFSNALRAVGV